jgi:5'-nucleotidase
MTRDEVPEVADHILVSERPASIRESPRLLLTNDDGVESPGLRLLASRLASRYEVVVAAPETDMSGSGTGIGRFDPDKGVDLHPVDMDGVEAYAVAGPPGLAVMAGALGAFGPAPDLVVSGINAGMNTGHSVIHSGTVGAVLTARTFGMHGVAVSLALSNPWQWQTGVEVSERIVEWILEQSGARIVLNVNVPAASLSDVAGVRWATLDEFGHFRVAVADEHGGKLQFEVAGSDAGLDNASDTALCRQNYVTITPLSAIETAPFLLGNAERLWSGLSDPVGRDWRDGARFLG